MVHDSALVGVMSFAQLSNVAHSEPTDRMHEGILKERIRPRSWARRLSRAFEMKPGAFGFAIDLRKLAEVDHGEWQTDAAP